MSRKKGEQRIFLSEEPILSLTRGHILGEKTSSGYQPHPSDVSSLEDAQELHLTDFAKIATGFERLHRLNHIQSERHCHPPRRLHPGQDDTSGSNLSPCHRRLPKAPTVPPDWEQEWLSCEAFNIHNKDGTTEETRIEEELQHLTTESNLAPIIAPVVTRKGKQRMLHHLPTPQESRQPPPTAPPGEMPPPPTPVAPPPWTRTRKQKDQGQPDPLFPTQGTATSAEAARSQDEHQGPYPTMVQRIASLLHKPQELMKRQKEDSHLLGKIQALDNGETGVEYVTEDDRFLWYVLPGFILCLAIHRFL